VTRTHIFGMLLLIAVPVAAADPKPTAGDRVLFDFEDAAEAAAWVPVTAGKAAEPAPKVERAAEHASTGRHSLKVTFAGGTWPTVGTTRVPEDWTPWATFWAEVTVARPCVIGFTVMQEGSKRGGDWDGAVSRWCTTAILTPGTHSLSAPLHPNEWSAIRPKLENGRVLGKCVSLEFFAYEPKDGDAVFIDNIRLTAVKEPHAEPKTEFRVLGTELTVTGVQDLGKRLAGQWKQPEPMTAARAEAAFRERFAGLKKAHPKAVLAVFRDGESGYDPRDPAKKYAGWADAYWSSHGPDSMTAERAANFGKSATQEVFMRHRSPLFRADLTSIPKGAVILAAEFLLVRAGQPGKEQHPNQPNMWVAEACNRPWVEAEVNAYRYAKEKFWKAYGGMHWAGIDSDFLPVYLAHGPGREGCNVWDFTEAVRFWTDGKHANYGFMLHGDSKDWFKAYFREAERAADRPALLVAYEPR
jgi:hypothetical protein